jgi:hypothetical protein
MFEEKAMQEDGRPGGPPSAVTGHFNFKRPAARGA